MAKTETEEAVRAVAVKAVDRPGRIGMRGKTLLAVGALLVFSFTVMGAVTYRQGASLAKSKALDTTIVKVEAEADVIYRNVQAAKKDLRVVAETPPVQGIIRAIDNGGTDPLGGGTVGAWTARMETILRVLLSNHPEYFQIRFIDEKGKELVRVETNEKGVVRPVHAGALQNKFRYDYFKKTMSIPVGEIYYSKVNLNREKGEIQVPYTPVFRLATPVTDKGGRVRGIVIINMFADHLFRHMTVDEGIIKYVANSDDYFLVHPDRAKIYGFDLGFEEKLTHIASESEEYANDASAIAVHDVAEKHFHALKKIFFDPRDRGRYWTIFYELPEVLVLRDIQSMRSTMLVVGFFVTLISVFVVVRFVSYKVVRPVINLTEAAKSMEEGDLSVTVATDGLRDEIGSLSASFNYMAKRLMEDRLEQEQYLEILKWNSSEREKRTAELEGLNKSLSAAHRELEVKNRRLEESIVEIRETNAELGETREQMIQSERMASVGQLAAGVAHELNNPLMGIMGFSQILLDMDGDVKVADVKPKLEKIFHESQRTAKIVQSLLTFARAKKSTPGRNDINEIIRKTLSLRECSVDFTEVELTLDLDEGLPLTMVDKFQMQQVLVNIIGNALDAISAKGEDKSLHIKTVSVDGSIIISITDSGEGISDEAASRVFEPFFTTKPIGTGTGLGLSISHGIVEEHGGTLELKGLDGGGAVATITIPIVEYGTGGAFIEDSERSHKA